jgi:hypothetical protein
VVNGDWLEADRNDQFDLVLSCMVMEHLDAEGERAFVDRARRSLLADGRMVSIVPASPEHWGIEDEIAGHFRRYTANSVLTLLGSAGWRVTHTAGLTFPTSNVLYPLTNLLVRRS